VLLASWLRTWKQALLIVQPETLLRWHRELFRRIWRRKSRSEGKPGRPPLSGDLILGQRHLHHTVKEYVRYFNLARPHQGIAQSIPCPPESLPHSGKIVSYPILGGLHHDYRRQAA
jgi:hypothetical protein